MLIETLQKQSGLRREQLDWYARTASRRYKIYEIPKRAGGTRTIAHPSRGLKALQRWISKFLFQRFPVHDCAMAYKKGASIHLNAKCHIGTSFTLRMDFEEFFPSFRREAICQFLRNARDGSDIRLTDDDISFVGDIVTRKNVMTIGAPSSPIISNVMLYKFDSQMAEFGEGSGTVYTRYADDVFVSSLEPEALAVARRRVTECVREYDVVPLSINSAKTVFLSKKRRRTITGLVLTPDDKISIGRARKREIRSLILKFIHEELSSEAVGRLQGLIAFSRDCERSYFDSLVRKYGYQIVDVLLKR